MKVKAASLGKQSSCKTVWTLILQTKDSRCWLNFHYISVVISKKEQICLRKWNRRQQGHRVKECKEWVKQKAVLKQI